jgi:hypothetical protein
MKAMKSIIFWNVTLCNPVEVHRRFGGETSMLIAAWFILLHRVGDSVLLGNVDEVLSDYMSLHAGR